MQHKNLTQIHSLVGWLIRSSRHIHFGAIGKKTLGTPITTQHKEYCSDFELKFYFLAHALHQHSIQ